MVDSSLLITEENCTAWVDPCSFIHSPAEGRAPHLVRSFGARTPRSRQLCIFKGKRRWGPCILTFASPSLPTVRKNPKQKGHTYKLLSARVRSAYLTCWLGQQDSQQTPQGFGESARGRGRGPEGPTVWGAGVCVPETRKSREICITQGTTSYFSSALACLHIKFTLSQGGLSFILEAVGLNPGLLCTHSGNTTPAILLGVITQARQNQPLLMQRSHHRSVSAVGFGGKHCYFKNPDNLNLSRTNNSSTFPITCRHCIMFRAK